MKYLVTGADGFLGRHFLARLAQLNIPAVAMVLPGLQTPPLPGDPQVVRADLLDAQSLRGATVGVTHVIHLAARVHMMNDTAADPDAAFNEVNVTGTRNVLTAAADSGATHFLLMSSVKAMGEEQTGAFDEDSPPQPQTPYGRSKLLAEQALLAVAAQRGMHAVVLRLPMVYGPGNKGNVLKLIEAADQGRRLPLGRVNNRRSMVYVGNVVEAALAAIRSERTGGQVYLVCDERPYGSGELYAAICRAMDKEPLLRNVPVWILKLMGRVGDAAKAILRRPMPVDSDIIGRLVGDLCFDCGKIHRDAGFSPSVGLDEGIAATVQWYRQGCGPTPPA